MEKKRINIDCTILKETYNSDGNNIECVLHCKYNLNEFEHQNFTFNKPFIKTLGNWLPTIKTIYNFTLSNPLIAKFYILPTNSGKTAKVLEYNTDYYRKFRKIPKDKLLVKGEIISVDKIPGVYVFGGETSELMYNETFKVTGVAKCHPDDTYNESNGRLIALNKAMTALNKRNLSINKAITKLLIPVVDGLDKQLEYIEFTEKQLLENKPNC